VLGIVTAESVEVFFYHLQSGRIHPARGAVAAFSQGNAYGKGNPFAKRVFAKASAQASALPRNTSAPATTARPATAHGGANVGSVPAPVCSAACEVEQEPHGSIDEHKARRHRACRYRDAGGDGETRLL
jgi:hypothetical protein